MIHAVVRDEKIAIIRIVLFSALAVYALAVPGERLALLPPELLRPAGFAQYLPLARAYWGILALRWCAAALLLGAALGLRPYRWLAFAGTTLFMSYVAILHPGHREIAAIYLAYGLTLAPTTRVWSLASKTAARAWSAPPAFILRVATFVFLIPYSLIGVERILWAAPKVFLDGSLLWHIAGNSARNGSFGFAVGYALLEHFPTVRNLLPLGFFVSTCLEALAPLALFWTGFRRVFLVFVLGFHLTNLLLLNIEFTLNTIVALLLLWDWQPPERARAGTSSVELVRS